MQALIPVVILTIAVFLTLYYMGIETRERK